MSTGTPTTRIVVTGLGVVSPIGIGKRAFWDSLVAGRTGIGFLKALDLRDLPSPFAAEVHDFDPRNFIREKKFLKVMSRDIQLGVAASSLAMQDTGLNRGDVEPDRLGVVYGAGRISSTPEELFEAVRSCSGDTGEFHPDRWNQDSMGRICPLWLLRQLPNMPACHVSIEHDARGPNNTITSRDSSALLALAEAIRVIERDAADVMIVGGCGSSIHPVDIAKLNLFEDLSRRHDDPTRVCRPFDRDRDGTIVGEGAASFVIERYEHAVARGAEIYAEVIGVGAGCDGKGAEDGAGGTGLVQAIRSALRRANMTDAREIGHINAHGKSTPRDDYYESRAFHKALGDHARQIPVTALKSYFGHSDAGSGAVELAGSLLALGNRELPVTLNYETPDPACPLNVIHDDIISLPHSTALSVNRTNMGQSAAAILRAV